MELVHAARDAVLASKIFKDGHSLTYFAHLKEEYDLTENEQFDLEDNLSRFEDFLARMGIETVSIKPFRAPVEAIEFAIHHGLMPADAYNLAIALTANCQYFVTSDRDFLERKNVIPRISIVRPATLSTMRKLRSKEKRSKPFSKH